MANSRPRSIEYGFSRLSAKNEYYGVPGAGAIWISLDAGDLLTIKDPEGGQTAELVVLNSLGQDDTAALSCKSDVKRTSLLDLLKSSGDASVPLRAELSKRKIDLEGMKAVQLFHKELRAGAEQTFVVQRDVTCIISASGRAMEPDQQSAPTALKVTIQRARQPNIDEVALPPPLAEPRLDIRIDRGTAQVYEVDEGEYVQIIDVSGRQCSDLLVFDAAQLQKGVERCFDPTITRTLMAAAYPGPGLFSKFFDQDMQPLIDVVQDTVGRHDTFALACYARAYDDMGYPGHSNCTDNMNAVLKPFGVASRSGWPAINLFSNTGFTSNLQLYVNEPWTRPGDYVLVRASKPLVCSSSACPDDVNPTNGWNPTDIHVRVYPKKNKFSKAIGIRMTPDSEVELTRETAFHPRTSMLTRHFSEYRGYWVPSEFENLGPISEYFACRERSTIMDLSPLRKFEILGPDAEELLQRTLTRDVRRIAVGQVSYAAACYESGGMIDDGTLFRLGQNNFRWVGGDDYLGLWLRQKASEFELNAQVKSSTDQLHNFAVQGPTSRTVLEDVVWTPTAATAVRDLERFRFVVGRIGDFNGPTVIVSRTGYTGELGFEVWCHPKDGTRVWDAVWSSGQNSGLAPMGMTALDMLRIEAGLVFSGYEFDDQTDPFEAGIGFVVDAKKDEEYIGSRALSQRKNTPQRRLVGLTLTGNEPAAHGDGVYVGRSKVGVITSATRSPILKSNIAMARLTTEYGVPGVEVEVGKLDGHQKRLPAVVVSLPFYDPQKVRVNAKKLS